MSVVVTPNEMARTLGVSGLRLRNWLRAKVAAGDPRLASHRKHERWEFEPGLAEELMADFRAEVLGRTAASPSAVSEAGPAPPSNDPGAVAVEGKASAHPRSSDSGHRVVEEWMGEQVETLEDLLRPGLTAVSVGINPAPRSVAAGHYYQGAYGQRFFARLRRVGLLPERFDGYEDDTAFAAGVGFTDLIKRPTVAETGTTAREREHGRPLLERKLIETGAPLVIFAFKSAAKTLFGRFDGNGFVPGLELGASEVFVMPGPTESTRISEPTLDTLAIRLDELRPDELTLR